MPKNIVLCLDGTGNEFGKDDTNVVKIHRVIERGASQLGYYHPGLGTLGQSSADWTLKRWLKKGLGLGFGWGITDHVQEAYKFLMRSFEPGDQVYIFGFSRGAYTARVLAGFLYECGLLESGLEALVPYAMKIFRQRDSKVALSFKQTFARACPVYFLGLWDTVSSVGWIYDAVTFPRTFENPGVSIVRHAVALDERRCKFRQNLYSEKVPGQDVKQVWFPGVHCDVGGGYPEQESGLSKLALEWMALEAQQCGLRLNQQEFDLMVKGGRDFAPASPEAEKHESLKGVWKLAEYVPLPHKVRRPDGRWVQEWTLYRGRPRRVEEWAMLHWSVEERMRRVPGYSPKNLPARYYVTGGQSQAQPASGD